MRPINRYRITTALFLGIFGYVPLWGQNIDFIPDRPDGPAKIQSALWELATPGAAKPTRDLQDTVVVILVPQLGQASASIDTSSMAALGVKVLAQSKSLMRISVPASSLLAVSELPGVRFVRRPHRPQAQQTWSEGGRLINAYDSYFEGVRGQGVKVAIIDGGFKGAHPDSLPRDMPGFWWRDYTGEGIFAGEDVHGTACVEIIYDVAPEAEFYLYKVGDLADLENATERAIRDSIDIISHSMSWLGTGIGDGKGIACDIVNAAADNGILWVNSAGNSAKSHYYQPWSDSDSDGWHNFVGEDETLGFEAEKGTEIAVYLTWNDWPETRDNYDLYLYFSDFFGNLEQVAKSTNIQRRDSPVEWIEYEADRSGEYHIVVHKSEEARSRRLKIWSFNRNLDFEYSSPELSIAIPADAEGAMSVGAVHADWNWSLDLIADYSSRGPTLDGRVKPDLVAPSGVSTVSYAPDRYTGTSAAAPHVAGAAALIKSAYPSYSRTQLWDALIDATVDIGTWGRDNDSGYGKLVLPVLLKQLPSTGTFGYWFPRVTENPQSVRFGFEGNGEPGLMAWELKNNAEVDILVNGKDYGWASESDDWQVWFAILSKGDLNFGQNVIEFRNRANQSRISSFSYWELRDVNFVELKGGRELQKPFNAKPVARTRLLSELPNDLASGLGDPFPSPFNAEVTIPFALAEAGPVSISVYNLMGQQIRVLADGWLTAGAHRVHWDGRTAAGVEAASGVYWAVLQADDVVQTAKLALIR